MIGVLRPDSVAVVVGTRPEMIKVAPLVRLLGDRARFLHTGQHFDEKLSGQFFAELGLPPPAIHLGVGGQRRGSQIGGATAALEEHFADDPADAIVVHGDTNATVAGALAANALGVPLVHVEAGLRSFDRAMPEEHNRIVVDHLADLCLAPTETNRANLAAEGIGGDRVILTGNTVVDAVLELLPSPMERHEVLAPLSLEPNRYVLATFHRPENVDEPEALRTILEELGQLPLPVVVPLHPRTRARIESLDLEDLIKGFIVLDPIGYREFLALASMATLLISDSGGVQEEASVLKRPVLVVRRSTERPEILGTFAQLVPPGPLLSAWANQLIAQVPQLHQRLESLPSPYGDGTAALRCAAAITTLLTRPAPPSRART
jgi:UDP-N-acetylglucosamine 2-epimerase (non-hydrolysing)